MSTVVPQHATTPASAVVFEGVDWDEYERILAAFGGFALELIDLLDDLDRDQNMVFLEVENRVRIVKENVGVKDVVFHSVCGR